VVVELNAAEPSGIHPMLMDDRALREKAREAIRNGKLKYTNTIFTLDASRHGSASEPRSQNQPIGVLRTRATIPVKQ